METLLFAAPGALYPALAAALFGLLVGSFLNVVIYRMPKMMQREFDNACAENCGKELPHTDKFNLWGPRSCCPKCGHQITAMENIPVISWLMLRGKCSNCKAPISPRYPAVELIAAIMSGALVWQFGSGWAGLAVMAFGLILLSLTLIDFDTQFLPDDLVYPLLWLGLLINLNGTFAPLRDAVIGAVAGYLVLWSVNELFKLYKGMDGMGNGDFKLLAALGAWMGWQLLPAIIVLSSVVGAVVGIAMMAMGGTGRETKIPFGPYLAGAGMLAMLFGPELSSGMLGLVQP